MNLKKESFLIFETGGSMYVIIVCQKQLIKLLKLLFVKNKIIEIIRN